MSNKITIETFKDKGIVQISFGQIDIMKTPAGFEKTTGEGGIRYFQTDLNKKSIEGIVKEIYYIRDFQKELRSINSFEYLLGSLGDIEVINHE